ncbi:MAG: hypothetical protein HY244_18480 [Rhizobiales bacterium]|nr:hypothetical protein [Hyphomicrobiales bacterium]
MMCIACELQMFFALEDLPPSTGTASHVDTRADAASRFACDTPADAEPPVTQPVVDERKP